MNGENRLMSIHRALDAGETKVAGDLDHISRLEEEGKWEGHTFIAATREARPTMQCLVLTMLPDNVITRDGGRVTDYVSYLLRQAEKHDAVMTDGDGDRGVVTRLFGREQEFYTNDAFASSIRGYVRQLLQERDHQKNQP